MYVVGCYQNAKMTREREREKTRERESNCETKHMRRVYDE